MAAIDVGPRRPRAGRRRSPARSADLISTDAYLRRARPRADDGRRAIELAREHADGSACGPTTLGMIGFSAGAFLAVDVALDPASRAARVHRADLRAARRSGRAPRARRAAPTLFPRRIGRHPRQDPDGRDAGSRSRDRRECGRRPRGLRDRSTACLTARRWLGDSDEVTERAGTFPGGSGPRGGIPTAVAGSPVRTPAWEPTACPSARSSKGWACERAHASRRHRLPVRVRSADRARHRPRASRPSPPAPPAGPRRDACTRSRPRHRGPGATRPRTGAPRTARSSPPRGPSSCAMTGGRARESRGDDSAGHDEG